MLPITLFALLLPTRMLWPWCSIYTYKCEVLASVMMAIFALRRRYMRTIIGIYNITCANVILGTYMRIVCTPIYYKLCSDSMIQ